MFCTSCGTQLQEGAKFCTACGRPTVASTQPYQPTPVVTQAKGSGAVGATSGLVGGLGCSVFLGIIGLALCFTGIGALIGIPMILAAFGTPIMGFFQGMKAIEGPCPYCEKPIFCSSVHQRKGGITCPACKNRVVIRGKTLVKLS
jgi:hypothetical protein